jgi:hypothetical protein
MCTVAASILPAVRLTIQLELLLLLRQHKCFIISQLLLLLLFHIIAS